MAEIGKLSKEEKYKKLFEMLGLEVGDFVKIIYNDADGLEIHEYYRLICDNPVEHSEMGTLALTDKRYYLLHASTKGYTKDITTLLTVKYEKLNSNMQNLGSCTCDEIYCTDCPFYYIVKGKYGNECWLKEIGGTMDHKCNMYIQNAIQSPYAKFMIYNKLRETFRITQMRFDEDCFKFKPYNAKDEFFNTKEDEDAKEKD